jgi:hypothetical protein
MHHTIVTYAAKPGRDQENAGLVRAVFEELAKTRPAGFRYAVFQAADSREFVHLYTDEGAAPGALEQLSAFQASDGHPARLLISRGRSGRTASCRTTEGAVGVRESARLQRRHRGRPMKRGRYADGLPRRAMPRATVDGAGR